MQYVDQYHSPIGRLTMCSDGIYLTGLWFDGQKYFGSTLEKNTLDQTKDSRNCCVLIETKRWLDAYFKGENPGKIPPILFHGSAFRCEVWKMLQEVPYGRTTTYGQMAASLAEMRGMCRVSAQAVGGAVAHNPISILIPCHRVLARDGSLTGYAGGIEKKKYLLDLESGQN